MSELIMEEIEELPQCEKCIHRLKLNVYISNRSEKLLEALAETNTNNVCLAFSYEGMAEIGTFGGLGCEVFVEKDEVEL